MGHRATMRGLSATAPFVVQIKAAGNALHVRSENHQQVGPLTEREDDRILERMAYKWNIN